MVPWESALYICYMLWSDNIWTEILSLQSTEARSELAGRDHPQEGVQLRSVREAADQQPQAAQPRGGGAPGQAGLQLLLLREAVHLQVQPADTRGVPAHRGPALPLLFLW